MGSATLDPIIRTESPPLRVDGAGVIRIGKTRVTLDSIVAAFHQGETAEEIARNFDSISLGEIYTVIGYYLEHTDDVENYLARRQAVKGEVQKEAEKAHSPIGVRERLLARRK